MAFTPSILERRLATVSLRSLACPRRSSFFTPSSLACSSSASFSLRLRAMEAFRSKSSGFSEVTETLRKGGKRARGWGGVPTRQ